MTKEEALKSIKELKEYSDRYTNFTLYPKSRSFSTVFMNQDIDYVQVHDLSNDIGFVGVFSWKNNQITSEDGDTYNDDLTIIGYRWFEHEGKKCLDIISEDW